MPVAGPRRPFLPGTSEDGHGRLHATALVRHAGKAEAHLSRMDHGVMTMAPAGPVVIPAHGRVVFKPSGLHVMLLGVKGRLMDGRNQPMMLRFERAGVVTATFQVRAQILDAGAPAAHPMDNMHGMPGM